MDETMNDRDAPQAEPPRFPPGPSPDVPPRARRSGSKPKRLYRDPGGPIGGVASGIAAYLDIDPVFVRLLWIAGLFAGIGVPAYLVCWLVIPKATSWPPPGHAEGASSPGSDRHSTLTSGLGIVALAVVLGWSLHKRDDLLLPAALVGGGIYLLNQRARNADAALPGRRAVGATPRGRNAARHASSGADASPPKDEFESFDPEDDLSSEEEFVPEREWSATKRVPLDPPGLVTPTVFSLLALGAGVCWALRAAGVAHPSVATAAAGGVVVVGAGLLSSLWLGRAPGLVPAGIGLAGLSLVASHVQPWFDAPQTSFAALGQRIQDLPARGAAGDRHYHPASLSDLQPEYSLGFGSVVVDLSDLDLHGETHRVDVRVGVGEATVIVPPHTSVDANGEVGIGEAHAFDHHDEGLGNNVQKTEISAGSGRLQVHVNVGIGKGVVRHAI
jgi:phage shock protein C